MNTFQITKSVCELLVRHGLTPMLEYRLPNGRRLDVAALGKSGNLLGVEVKLNESDFNRDLKWGDTMNQCFLFYFAVPVGFNIAIIHPGIRLMHSDGATAWISRHMGRGLLTADRWDTARGPHAVKPVLPAAPFHSAPSGDGGPLGGSR